MEVETFSCCWLLLYLVQYQYTKPYSMYHKLDIASILNAEIFRKVQIQSCREDIKEIITLPNIKYGDTIRGQ